MCIHKPFILPPIKLVILLPSPKIILASLYVGFKVTILVMYSLRYLCVNA